MTDTGQAAGGASWKLWLQSCEAMGWQRYQRLHEESCHLLLAGGTLLLLHSWVGRWQELEDFDHCPPWMSRRIQAAQPVQRRSGCFAFVSHSISKSEVNLAEWVLQVLEYTSAFPITTLHGILQRVWEAKRDIQGSPLTSQEPLSAERSLTYKN